MLVIAVPGSLIGTQFALYVERAHKQKKVEARRLEMAVRVMQLMWRIKGNTFFFNAFAIGGGGNFVH